jgi:hypothetical protein
MPARASSLEQFELALKLEPELELCLLMAHGSWLTLRWLAGARRTSHIQSVPASLLPYALPTPIFRFRHLASLAGRAPIGGAREVALACFVAARLVSDCCDPELALDERSRLARCTGAKAWLGTIAIPAPVRTPVARCADASTDADRQQMAPLVSALATAAAAFLDPAARAELDALVEELGRPLV